MNTIGSGTMLAPGAGASVDLGLGCPTIKVGRSLSRQIGLSLRASCRREVGFRSRTGMTISTRSSMCSTARSSFCSTGSGIKRPRAARCSSRPGPCTPSATPATRPARQLVAGPVEVAGADRRARRAPARPLGRRPRAPPLALRPRPRGLSMRPGRVEKKPPTEAPLAQSKRLMWSARRREYRNDIRHAGRTGRASALSPRRDCFGAMRKRRTT